MVYFFVSAVPSGTLTSSAVFSASAFARMKSAPHTKDTAIAIARASTSSILFDLANVFIFTLLKFCSRSAAFSLLLSINPLSTFVNGAV